MAQLTASRRGLLRAGATPFMLSQRAVHKLRQRRQAPTCYLFDMELNGRYWHWWDERSVHNTGLTTNWCAARLVATRLS